MTLVETLPGESDAAFREAVDAMLQSICPDALRWWHSYEVRGVYAYNGIRFRHFYCIAGSVELWIERHARVDHGPRRVIMIPDESLFLFGGVKMVGRGLEVDITLEQLVQVETGRQ